MRIGSFASFLSLHPASLRIPLSKFLGSEEKNFVFSCYNCLDLVVLMDFFHKSQSYQASKFGKESGLDLFKIPSQHLTGAIEGHQEKTSVRMAGRWAQTHDHRNAKTTIYELR